MDDNLSLTKKLQLKELEILKVFQEVCRKHNPEIFCDRRDMFRSGAAQRLHPLG